ncbi:cobaltochelatase subunit CobN [Aureispira anguillae]|uniref:Cobaltochelatase subunit CobN n=1 Tax=Aureispira anguillae TaxID=2864201 RepID=A0A915YDN3_9BACT|nr:cobaltochelatase subunit CobN [Aureispira anguillae]BDS11192.1 cobaltochelatase subunit CobN [Aureispira anguillae]
MHLISTIPGGWNPNDDGVFYIEQQAGDLIFLSAGDTEISAVNEAYRSLNVEGELPSLRLANLTYFKQELTIDTYLEEVASKAKVIVMRLLGGKSYYSYFCEAIIALLEEADIELIFLPGHDQPDWELMQLSTIPFTLVDEIWKYFVAGGIFNVEQALKLIFNTQFDSTYPIQPIRSIPHSFLYHYEQGILSPQSQAIPSMRPVALITSYRTHYLSNNLLPLQVLSEMLALKGFYPVVLMALSYRDKRINDTILELLNAHDLVPQVLINTTGFALSSFDGSETSTFFESLNIPLIQAIFASCNKATWEAGLFGLPPTDVAMNIALPEMDGKIITTAISFKESMGRDEQTDSEIVAYQPHKEGCQFVADFAANWVKLRQKNAKEKRIALIVPNYPNKNSRLANGVGLDTPQSVLEILKALKDKGYELGTKIPQNTTELIDELTSFITNEIHSSQLKEAQVLLSETDFLHHYGQLSPLLRSKIEEQWGAPTSAVNYRNGWFLIPGLCLGNIFVSIQPSRGYNMDLQATYHSPDLVPTQDYLAYYFWVQHKFNADAVVHVGKHGNLEWLPGKSVALSASSCFPAMVFGAIPHFYPFIINDPGEGTQAKRRNQAIILDHLIPPMTRAENHGDLLQLELLIDEYYEAALLDPKRANLIKNKIENLVQSSHLSVDLNSDGKDIETLLEVIDGYLCELKEAQIRGGLHIFGQMPKGEKLSDLILALHRLPQARQMGLTQALAKDMGLDFDPLDTAYETVLKVTLNGMDCRTIGQAVEWLELKSKLLIEALLEGELVMDSLGKYTQQVLVSIKEETLPKLNATQSEITNLLNGLDAGYVPSGGSGAPTRGRLDILPTGRNFYSVDIRTIPSPHAFELGKKSADNIISRYLQEEGTYPTSIGISVWGTSTMRTGGDDISQALALIGVRPIWQGANRRVIDFEIISTLELKRPRVDVLLRISGFFRDAFPDVISLFNAVVERVAELDESDEFNPIKARYQKEKKEWLKKGIGAEKAKERALYRVFGSKPGAYGAGLQGVIDEKNWRTKADLAEVYMNWSGYAYFGNKNEGHSAHEVFKSRLSSIDIVVQNQDNREHDILDSDDYYQFQGGMAVAVEQEKGSPSTLYFGDHSRPENPRIKSLKQELLKVYRSRVINPKWIKGMQDHGYKGAFEMAATMDYLFAYDATTELIDDFMYEGMTQAYLLDENNQNFIRTHNKWAIRDMSERMLEAIQRGMWQAPSAKTTAALEQLLLDSIEDLE